MAGTFEAFIVRRSTSAEPVQVQMEGGEVRLSDMAGEPLSRIPVSRIIGLAVDNSPRKERGNLAARFNSGYTVEIAQAGEAPLRIRATTGGDLFTAVQALGGSGEAQQKLMSGIIGYRQFVVELAGAVRQHKMPITVGRRGLVQSTLGAIVIALVGAGMIGWQIYQPTHFMLFVIGAILIFGGANMIRLTPGSKPRVVDGSATSLEAYLPPLAS